MCVCVCVPVHTWTIQTTAKDVWNKLSLQFDASRKARSHWHLVCVCVCARARARSRVLCACVRVRVCVCVGVCVRLGGWVFAILFVEERVEM